MNFVFKMMKLRRTARGHGHHADANINRFRVRLLLKNLHFLLKNVEILLKNVDFLLKHADFIIKSTLLDWSAVGSNTNATCLGIFY